MKVIQKLAFSYIKFKFKLIAFFSKKKAAQKVFQLFCTPFVKLPKKQPAIFETAKKLNFKLNGLNINGYKWNHSRPHKILILHGFSSASYKFNYYIEAFTNKGYEVLAFDAPAHGNSDGKTTNAVEYSVMIKKVIELYGPIRSFMAHSFGGMALSLALEDIPHDEDDDVTPVSDALKVKEDKLPNIEFVITKGLGHRKIYHDAAIKKRVVDFLCIEN